MFLDIKWNWKVNTYKIDKGKHFFLEYLINLRSNSLLHDIIETMRTAGYQKGLDIYTYNKKTNGCFRLGKSK